MSAALLAQLIAQVGLPAAEYLFNRMRSGGDVTNEDFIKLKEFKTANERYLAATGKEAPPDSEA